MDNILKDKLLFSGIKCELLYSKIFLIYIVNIVHIYIVIWVVRKVLNLTQNDESSLKIFPKNDTYVVTSYYVWPIKPRGLHFEELVKLIQVKTKSLIYTRKFLVLIGLQNYIFVHQLTPLMFSS